VAAVTLRGARVADAAAMARVHVASWRSTYRGLMRDAVLDDPGFVGRREDFWTADPNPRAQAFYRKHGFAFDGAEQLDGGVRERRMVRQAGRWVSVPQMADPDGPAASSPTLDP